MPASVRVRLAAPAGGRWIGVVVAAVLLLAAAPARAIMSGAESRLAPSGDADYAAGKAAFERDEWQAAIAHLTLVLVNRPWHDNANTMVAYAWRKLGEHELAFAHYARALEQNPRHRGALEYLGEAYLDLGRVDEARTTLLRLVRVCDDVVMAFDNTGWKSGCEELLDLKAAFAERDVPLPGEGEP